MNSDLKHHYLLDAFLKEVWIIAASLEWTKVFIAMLMLTYPLYVQHIFLEKLHSSVCWVAEITLCVQHHNRWTVYWFESHSHPTGVSPKLVLPMQAEEPLWVGSRSVPANPSDDPGQGSQRQKKTLNLLFESTLSSNCFAVLEAGGRGDIFCSDSAIAFYLLKVITLAFLRYSGFWLKAFLCHSKRKK